LDGVFSSFMSGFHTASAVAAGICLVGAAGALLLPGRISHSDAEHPTRQPEPAAA
jgi:hypothetical protein